MDPNIAALAPLPVDNIYHLGFLVRDLEQAMDQYGKVFGMEWGDPSTSMPVPGRDGETYQVRYVLSTQGPPFIELLTGVDSPGGPPALSFDQAPPGIHHIGLYTERWRDELKRLEELGLTIEGVSNGYGFARSPLGFRVEVVSWKGRGFLLNYLASNGRQLGAP